MYLIVQVKRSVMKSTFYLFVIAFYFFSCGCSNVSPDALDLEVDFSWQGIVPCSWGNPEISIGGVPDSTKFLEVKMYDPFYLCDTCTGAVKIHYDGSGIIKSGVLEDIQAPCQSGSSGDYKITMKALDGNGVVVGTGNKRKHFPEKK